MLRRAAEIRCRLFWARVDDVGGAEWPPGKGWMGFFRRLEEIGVSDELDGGPERAVLVGFLVHEPDEMKTLARLGGALQRSLGIEHAADETLLIIVLENVRHRVSA